MCKDLQADPSQSMLKVEDDPTMPLQPKENKVTYRMIFIMIITAITHYGAHVVYSQIAPFFPIEAEKRGISKTLVGTVIAIYQFSMIFIHPANGKLVSIIGVRTMRITGIVICGLSTITFGFYNRIESNKLFIAMCLTSRILEALGASMIVVVDYCVVVNIFPNHLPVVTAILLACKGVAFLTGPLIGGSIYAVGGYTVPFIVAGLMVFSSGFLAICFTPKVTTNGKGIHWKDVLIVFKIKGAVLAMLLTCLEGAMIFVLEPILALHLRHLGFTVQQGSLFFLISPTALVVFALFSIYLMKKKIYLSGMCFGLLLAGISLFIISPTPIFGLHGNMSTLVIAVVLLGIGTGLGNGACYASQLTYIRWVYNALPHISKEYFVVPHECRQSGMFSDSGETCALSTGINYAAYAAGGFLGPQIAGYLGDAVGFAVATNLIGAGCVIITLSSWLTLAFIPPLFKNEEQQKN